MSCLKIPETLQIHAMFSTANKRMWCSFDRAVWEQWCNFMRENHLQLCRSCRVSCKMSKQLDVLPALTPLLKLHHILTAEATNVCIKIFMFSSLSIGSEECYLIMLIMRNSQVLDAYSLVGRCLCHYIYILYTLMPVTDVNPFNLNNLWQKTPGLHLVWK